MVKLTRGQKTVLIVTAVPMAAVGTAGGIATYFNMNNVLHSATTSMGVVAAGEGATLICALVTLSLTLLGQHTPATVRLGLWILPLLASGVGVTLAEGSTNTVVMALTPMAMTAAGEGIALVARRIVRFQTGVDLEKQRLSGLLLWHANRSQNGGRFGRKLSSAAVWRLTKKFVSTDAQLSTHIGVVQSDRIAFNADANLAAALSGQKHAALGMLEGPAAPALDAPAPAARPRAKQTSAYTPPWLDPETAERPSAALEAASGTQTPGTAPEAAEGGSEADTDGWGFISGVLVEAEEKVATDPTVKLLTVAEVAALKGVREGTVRSWATTRNRLRVHDRDANGQLLFHPLDVANME